MLSGRNMNHGPERWLRWRLARGRYLLCGADARAPRSLSSHAATNHLQLCRKELSAELEAGPKLSEQTVMNLLPPYDAQTSQAERGVFLILGLVAVVQIVITGSDGLLFAGKLEESPSAPWSESLALIKVTTKPSSTNLTIVQPTLSGERTRLNSVALPPS